MHYNICNFDGPVLFTVYVRTFIACEIDKSMVAYNIFLQQFFLHTVIKDK